MPKRVEFISYDGSFPNLCSGTLVLKIDGVKRIMPPFCMWSGGGVWFDDDGYGRVESGRWGIRVLDDLIELKDEIEDCVNTNVPYGCCGGCI